MTESDKKEKLRLAVREQALASTYFMAKNVIGYKDMTVGTHKPMCDFIDDERFPRKLGMAPRDHLKTSCWTIAHCVRLIAKDPEIRILLANETATNASKMLGRIQKVFTHNPYFQSLFPELVQDVSKTKWNQNEMLVPRTEERGPESTVEVIGVDGAAVSRHYDYIKLDDLVGKEASESPVVMQKTIDWYLLCESLLVHPELSCIDLYGTRWAWNDLYSYAEEHEGDYLLKYIIDAEEDEHGNVRAFWPERFPLEVLERIKKKMGPFKYSCQYKNHPHDPEGGSFKKEWLRYYALEGGVLRTEQGAEVKLSELRITMRVDPAISQNRKACRTAIVVDGIDALGRKFILETWAERCAPSVMWDNVFRLQATWNPERVGIESVAYQKVLQYNAQDEMAKRGAFINVTELRPVNNQSKDSRILGVQPHFRRGEVFLLRSMDDFEHEYTGFPVGKTCDLLDIFAYGPQMWESPELADELEDEGLHWSEESYEDGRSQLTGY